MKADLYPEEEIIEGCKKEKRHYQELLYRRYAPKMYGVCLSYAKNREQARDILHDAFLKIFKNIKTYKSQGSFEGWIRRIISNTAIDYIRQKSKDITLISEETPDIQDEESSNQPQMKLTELLAQVARLPDGARMIFNMYTLEGMTHVEIASHLKISVGTSKSQFNRARQLLQQWINEITKKQDGFS
jgi:RNA polymerase sigma factor (sigma-70 family)